MNSRAHGSEDACACLDKIDEPQILIGGLGMGFTLAAALNNLNAGSRVVVGELLPSFVDWNRGPLAVLAG